jgi:predicted nucleic acid-binding protein
MQAFQHRALVRHNFTAYDAFYVVLAEALDLPLLTDDGEFANASGHAAHIETWPAAQ